MMPAKAWLELRPKMLPCGENITEKFQRYHQAAQVLPFRQKPTLDQRRKSCLLKGQVRG